MNKHQLLRTTITFLEQDSTFQNNYNNNLNNSITIMNNPLIKKTTLTIFGTTILLSEQPYIFCNNIDKN